MWKHSFYSMLILLFGKLKVFAEKFNSTCFIHVLSCHIDTWTHTHTHTHTHSTINTHDLGLFSRTLKDESNGHYSDSNLLYVYPIFTLLSIRVGKVFHWPLFLIVFSTPSMLWAVSLLQSPFSNGSSWRRNLSLLKKVNLIILFHFRVES